MGKYLGSLSFATCVLTASTLSAAASPKDEASAEATVAVQRVHVPATGLRDEAAMLLVGTALIGLGAAVRRSA